MHRVWRLVDAAILLLLLLLLVPLMLLLGAAEKTTGRPTVLFWLLLLLPLLMLPQLWRQADPEERGQAPPANGPAMPMSKIARAALDQVVALPALYLDSGALHLLPARHTRLSSRRARRDGDDHAAAVRPARHDAGLPVLVGRRAEAAPVTHL